MRMSFLFKSRFLIVSLFLVMTVIWVWAGTSEVWAGETDIWQTEFEELSRPAGGAMELPADQLESLLARCKALKEKLPVLDESARKVYGRRLQMTCDLYQFMLDSKRAAAEVENPKQ